MSFVSAEDVAQRYNSREMVEAYEDIRKLSVYRKNDFTDLCDSIVKQFKEKQQLTDKQFYALARHIAYFENS